MIKRYSDNRLPGVLLHRPHIYRTGNRWIVKYPLGFTPGEVRRQVVTHIPFDVYLSIIAGAKEAKQNGLPAFSNIA